MDYYGDNYFLWGKTDIKDGGIGLWIRCSMQALTRFLSPLYPSIDLNPHST